VVAVTERITLTDDEMEAAAAAAYIEHELAVRGDGRSGEWNANYVDQDKWRHVIAHAVVAVNNVRAGDPVATIRRNPSSGAVYERYEKDGRRYWEALNPWPTMGIPRAIHEDPDGISDWPVIYTPEVSS
jgi:hypothetical protein